MMIILFAAAIILFIIAIGIWWRVFFGTANPPLSRSNVSIASSSSPAAGATVNSAENPELSTEGLSIDGATFNVELATTTVEQARGLSFRTSLGANAGCFSFSARQHPDLLDEGHELSRWT